MREVARTCCMLASIGHLMRKLSPHPHTSSLAHPRCCAFCALLAQEVAVSHHASFVAAAEAVGAVRSELQEADARLGALQAAVPRLQEECEAFSARAAEVVAKRKANKAALSAHGTMLDLLEAPALVDTCVRNGSFDEALDLEETLKQKMQQLSGQEFEGVLHPVFQEDELTLILVGAFLGMVAGFAQAAFF